MKHIWVIFKLILLIVFALRLLKANRKEKQPRFQHDHKRGLFNLFHQPIFSEKIIFHSDELSNEQQLKDIFRKQIRPKEEAWKQDGKLFDDFFATLSLEERMIYIAYLSNKTFQKGSVFNFLWYKTEWIIAFSQMLKHLHEDALYAHYQQVVHDTCHLDFDTLPTQHSDFFILDFYPDGSQEFESVKQFNQIFDRNIFLQKIILATTQNQQNHP